MLPIIIHRKCFITCYTTTKVTQLCHMLHTTIYIYLTCFFTKDVTKVEKKIQLCIARLVEIFPKVSRLLPAATAADLETPCAYACLSYSPKLCLSTGLRAWPLIFKSKIL